MNKSTLGFLAFLAPTLCHTAYAEIYMTDEKALATIFPAASQKFEKTRLSLSDAEAEKIRSLSQENVRSKDLVLWKNKAGDVMFVDQVLGKHEFITFAVGIGTSGQVVGVEILEYRESYGQQVRKQNWLQQFIGKTISSKLKLDDDIKNISGATLSSSHVTGGIKRLLQTYDIIKKRL
jgi:Na+-translocating ferredoxin:NAD+ oxidoreductase RnfG subunit